MKLYYYKNEKVSNFGDELNPWMWHQILGRPISELADGNTLFIGIGTLLNKSIPSDLSRKIVFGSGASHREPPAMKGWTVYCVRGPLTAKKCGLPAAMAISDSALLVRMLVNPSATQSHGVSFMPHYISKRGNWEQLCNDNGILYIDPSSPVKETIEKIRNSRLLITEAMHGAIIADALRIRWFPIKTSNRISDFKWQDWMMSLNMDVSRKWIPPIYETGRKRLITPFSRPFASSRLLAIANSHEGYLSADDAHLSAYERLIMKFELLKKDLDCW